LPFSFLVCFEFLEGSLDSKVPRLVLFIVGNAKFYQEKKIPGNKIEI
jgi:hypothetical protein